MGGERAVRLVYLKWSPALPRKYIYPRVSPTAEEKQAGWMASIVKCRLEPLTAGTFPISLLLGPCVLHPLSWRRLTPGKMWP